MTERLGSLGDGANEWADPYSAASFAALSSEGLPDLPADYLRVEHPDVVTNYLDPNGGQQ